MKKCTVARRCLQCTPGKLDDTWRAPGKGGGGGNNKSGRQVSTEKMGAMWELERGRESGAKHVL